MQYEYIGHVPNDNGYVKGKNYFVNPKRDGDHVVCNILDADDQLNRTITKEITTIVYHDIPAFRRDWKVVSAEFVQGRSEPAEVTNKVALS